MTPKIVNRNVLADKYKKLVEVEYKFPNGEKIEWVYLEGAESVVIFPIDREGNILAVEQFRYTHGDRTLELPMGFVPKGKTVEEAAVTELFEETGYHAEEIKLHGKYRILSGETNREVNFVLARNLIKRKRRVLGESIEERLSKPKCKKISYDEVYKGLLDGHPILSGVESNFALTLFRHEMGY